MNKTVNINLAGIFFHIDEDAYLKLQRYLEAIKRSFTDSQGRSEIIADIEARIAELFNERVQNDKQVIRIAEVDEVISVMGQPEDYLVDDEIFEDEPQASYRTKSTTSRKLFRDTDNSYVGGVSSGLSHYFGVDAIWIRLAWILLIFGAGTGILLYILLWILVPEAKTTAEKIMMTGEPVNISNIEKKIKDGFETVTETVGDVAKNVSDSVSNAAKNIDVKKTGNSIKSSSRSFFETIGDIIMFFFKVFSKFIGVLLIIASAATLIALIVALFSVGIADVIHIPGLDLVEIANTGETPIWLVSLCAFFAVGIPFFFLFYLGLKILINNLKSIGNLAKFSLLGLWIISIIALIIFGVRQASEHAYEESYTEKTELPITAKDTLTIKMVNNDNFNSDYGRHDNFKLAYNDNGDKVLYSADIDIIVKSTTDSVARVAIRKKADGRDYDSAIERAKNINYNFDFKNNTLLLDSYLTTHPDNKFSDQEVDVVLYLPENAVTYFNNSAKGHLNYRTYDGNIISRDDTNHYMKIIYEDAVCLDCPEENIKIKVNTPSVKINDDGIEIHSNEGHLKIDKNGIKAESEEVNLNINAEGVEIDAED
ncbi:PspC domain-containing protein [Algibacter amylolyticus]|uniref:PspC domain-containing protein n=1 Tax=Algibacter amylolyticus TaxID=1608400 RepID=A0A5M7B7A3_9FLAO|nr:PspC domain-containing protein [Algibacter amylolyticus]KAA5823325.1 PspC domain-containing protein [Algibacter amylolyticus]MBB5267467.1 phage shock protein PspC (stress-responsive transcriptional regulator) [Algibacter amylolyticus]TSJ73813.1 PspC domain-containing protein [Algibacter amylolyticus]